MWIDKWERWFAWYPVYIPGRHRMRWLAYVEYRRWTPRFGIFGGMKFPISNNAIIVYRLPRTKFERMFDET